MILAVDDDRLVLEHVRSTLEEGGFEVVTFEVPDEALEWAKTNAPELVISDVRMPAMDGFAFRDAYQQIRPDEQTPFMFMSSMSDDETVVQGLESGADDYLIKPVSGPILVAKVKSILRKKVPAQQQFRGDLSNISLARVLRFCESKALTGQVSVDYHGKTYHIDLEAGEVTDTSEDVLDVLLLVEEGTFTIWSRPVDLSGGLSSMTDARRGRSRSAATRGSGRASGVGATRAEDMTEPMGLLSAVRAGGRLFQIQTEIAHHPSRAIVTLVTVDGRSVSKRTTPAPEQLNHDVLEQLVKHQHEEVEGDLKRRIESVATKPKPPSNVSESQATEDSSAEPHTSAPASPATESVPPPSKSPSVEFERLFDQGFDYARQGKLEEAIETWERAKELNPFNNVLSVNLQIIRKKLLKQQGKLDPFE